MKKFILFATMMTMFIGATSCTKSQTELSGDTLETTVIVSGHVRYIAYGKSGAEDPEIVDPGTPVKIFYGVPGTDGKVNYALKTMAVNSDGFFETKIGCPAGQTLEVKVQSFMSGNSYTVTEDGKSTDSDAYFFGEVKKNITCGSAAYFQVDIKPVAYTSEPGLRQ